MKPAKIILLSSLVTVAIVALIAFFFLSPYLIPRSFPQTFGYNPDNVARIELVDGDSGSRAQITDKEEIRKFLTLFDGKKLKKQQKQQLLGMGLKADLYTDSDQLICALPVGASDRLKANGYFYEINVPFTKEEIAAIYRTYPFIPAE